MRILILANSRYKGGASGGDKIYESFVKYWAIKCDVKTLEHLDYKPFTLCYIHRILEGIRCALFDNNKYEFVYSSSDFLPDVIPALIYKMKGNRWVAGFFLNAFKENKIHYFTQKFVKSAINKWADVVILTNPTMYNIFKKKNKTWINGGIDTDLAYVKNSNKKYDAVFCGRIHPTKGISILIKIWHYVRHVRPDAKLAIIGDGDLGIEYVNKLIRRMFGFNDSGITLLGYMGDERYDIYRQSKIVLYPTPMKYDHFSMAPVEAMACGCPLVAFKTLTTMFYHDHLDMEKCYLADNEITFAEAIVTLIDGDWKLNVLETAEWAKQFDYKHQSLDVLDNIREILVDENIDNGTPGNGGDGTVKCFV